MREDGETYRICLRLGIGQRTEVNLCSEFAQDPWVLGLGYHHYRLGDTLDLGAAANAIVGHARRFAPASDRLDQTGRSASPEYARLTTESTRKGGNLTQGSDPTWK